MSKYKKKGFNKKKNFKYQERLLEYTKLINAKLKKN